jgi:hypothetical protein
MSKQWNSAVNIERKEPNMNPEEQHDLLTALKKPFPPTDVYWKPGSLTKDQSRAMAMAYADLRAYQNRLDEVCSLDWSVTYTGWGERLICHLTIGGVTRSSTGEPDMQAEKSEIAGTAAEAQAFKRACSAFGLGRYLYQLPTMWVDYDAQSRQFSESAKTKLMNVVMQHYAFAAEPENEAAHSAAQAGPPDPVLERLRQQFERLGQELYGEQWAQVCQRNVERITQGQSQNANELLKEEVQKLIDGMKQIKRQRRTTPKAAPSAEASQTEAA